MTLSNERPLEGRVALVTGAGRGLGRAYALTLARHGALVAVNSRSEASVKSVADEITDAGGRAICCPGDLEAPQVPEAVVNETISALGRLDVLVNNAGGDGAAPAPFASISRADRSAMLRKNLDTAWDVTAAAWDHLISSGSGRIIMASSSLAFYGQPGLAHYAAAKGAVVGLARTLAVEGRDHGLTVNVLNPIANTGERQVFDRWTSSFSSEHVAAAVSWLASDTCTLTGQILSVGGTRMGRLALVENAGHVAEAEFAHPLDVARHVEEMLRGGDAMEFYAMSEFNAYLDRIYGAGAEHTHS